MVYYRDGLKVPNHIWEAAAMHRLILVECRMSHCGNRGIFDPHALWWLFERRGWDGYFRVAERRFYCRPCSTVRHFRVKNAQMSPIGAGNVTHPLPMPSELDWKKFLSRHRG